MKRCRCCALLISIVLLFSAWSPLALAEEQADSVTILFTHDLHSHFLPQSDGKGGESGGYARLKTVIDREKANYPDALLLDAGDFSVGSLVHTLYSEQAAELRTMGALGYDAVAVGNHEFDHESGGFAEMLTAAKSAQKAADRVLADSRLPGSLMEDYQRQYGPLTFALPEVVLSNYRVSPQNPEQAVVETAMEYYGVRETLLLERGGVTFGIFALVGEDSHECAPTSGFDLLDAAETAKRCVEELESRGAEVIICLSHSGTGESLEVSEDEVLAEKVPGIDILISGHTHTTLEEPIVVGDTYIVSAGSYCQNLGSVTFENGADGLRLLDYHLAPVDESVPEDPEIAALTEQWKTMVGEKYLAPYGLTYDQVLTVSDYDLLLPKSGVQEGSPLGELAADAFLWAVEHLEADAPHTDTVSVTADGVLRAPLYRGEITVSEAFDVLSMGVGTDGTSGFPLVGVYLTGWELRAVAEVDASVTPIMPAAQLYMGGMKYSFNTHRMFFDRVMEARLCEPPFVNGFEGSGLAEIEDDRLYRVVTGMYSAQMLGTVKEKSMGLLSLEPKMADGTPVTDFNDCILRDAGGNELKEWYALAAYLDSFGEEGLPEQYEDTDGRKTVSHSWDPAILLKNPGWPTLAVLGAGALLLVLTVLAARSIVRRIRRRKRG